MLISDGSEVQIHFPANPNKFEFDEEVAEIFDDMAVRSIPLYRKTQAIAAAFTVDVVKRNKAEGKVTRILDIGASTGAYFRSVWRALGVAYDTSIDEVHAVAIDSSLPMVNKIRKILPHVEALVCDATKLHGIHEQFDIINVSYLVQFIPVEKRGEFWNKLYRLITPGGFVIVSNKYVPEHPFIDIFARTYIEFRLTNGYSQEEIEAKTRALNGSMWPERLPTMLCAVYNAGFTGYQEVSRWLHFATGIISR